ncbi:hypothetical protein [Streptomyces reticuliscabiei]|uniref:hypothetical protein n=1 Tax=Streptomyces reticuliscabiei TaxID=146821 RepID=UPI000A3B166D|nr:hypothetical protein [Streptomyces reticuliscabiei]
MAAVEEEFPEGGPRAGVAVVEGLPVFRTGVAPGEQLGFGAGADLVGGKPAQVAKGVVRGDDDARYTSRPEWN